MADRNVEIKVSADTTPAARAMDSLAKSTAKVGEAGAKATQNAGKGLSGLAQHARDNASAWSTVGGSLATFGGAVTGLAGAVSAVGISYNTLQQTSLAAMETLMGSTEAAQAQMEKLYEFTSTSPFAKQVFIEAQQQLIGFGREAEEVIPILSAVQDAVAATGGSNQEISELVSIIAKIGAAGKISAEDLNQLGERGIDAATIIGEQMGMTGAQIRESISNGALGAEDAIAALTAGMSERFGGAAAAVKDTMAGAFDRVKAAVRDVSSEFMTMFVDPTGGGLAVDGLNKVADALRQFQSLPGPVKNAAGAIGALTGAAALAGGAAIIAVPRLVALYDALGEMGTAGATAQAGMRGLPKIVGGLVVAGTVYAGMRMFAGALDDAHRASRDAVPGINAVQAALEDMQGSVSTAPLDELVSGLNFDSMFRVATDINSVADAMERVHNPTAYQRLSDWHGAFIGITTESEMAADALSTFDEALSALASADPEAAAEQWGTLTTLLSDVGFSAEEIAASFPLMSDAMIGMQESAEAAAEGASSLSEHIAGIDPSILQEKAAGIREANQSIVAAFIDLGEGINDSELSLEGWISGLEEQVAAQAAAVENAAYLIGQGMNAELVRGLMEEGPDGALRLQQLADEVESGNESVIPRMNEVGSAMGGAIHEGLSEELAGADPVVIRAEAQLEAQQVAEEREKLTSIFYRDPATVPIEADTSGLDAGLAKFMIEAAQTIGVANLDANDIWATQKIDQWNAYANNTVGMPTLDADPVKAAQQIEVWLAAANRAVGRATLDALTTMAESKTLGWREWASGLEAMSQVTADTNPAISGVLGLMSWVASQTATLNVQARYAGGLNIGGANSLYSSARAAGGVERRPMMGGPGYGPTNVILWGEPETRGEAFISNHPAYKAQNLAYLQTAASWFGKTVVDAYAGGHVSGTYAPTGGSSLPSHLTLVDESGALLGRMRVVAQRETGRALATVTRRTR